MRLAVTAKDKERLIGGQIKTKPNVSLVGKREKEGKREIIVKAEPLLARYLSLPLGFLDCLVSLLVVLFEERIEANGVLFQHLPRCIDCPNEQRREAGFMGSCGGPGEFEIYLRVISVRCAT